jgi:hypothetical protein
LNLCRPSPGGVTDGGPGEGEQRARSRPASTSRISVTPGPRHRWPVRRRRRRVALHAARSLCLSPVGSRPKCPIGTRTVHWVVGGGSTEPETGRDRVGAGSEHDTVGAWRSLVAHLNGVQEVERSNRSAPTTRLLRDRSLRAVRRNAALPCIRTWWRPCLSWAVVAGSLVGLDWIDAPSCPRRVHDGTPRSIRGCLTVDHEGARGNPSGALRPVPPARRGATVVPRNTRARAGRHHG